MGKERVQNIVEGQVMLIKRHIGIIKKKGEQEKEYFDG